MADPSDILTEAQDAYFEGSMAEAERLCRSILDDKDCQAEAYELLHEIFSVTKEYEKGTRMMKPVESKVWFNLKLNRFGCGCRP